MARSLGDASWQNIIDRVRASSPDLIRPWFSELTPIEMTGGVLAVHTTSPSRVRYLNDRCRIAFSQAAQDLFGRIVTVSFETDADEETSEPLSFEREEGLQLADDYIFNNFVTGPCNRLAHAASVAVAESPGRAYNPLFVHGDVGLGKTHLLQAVCQEILRKQPETNIVYLSCETFTNHFIESVERGKLHQFRYRYRHADFLVIDDIQFLAERERSQEEFFHTFNTLYQSKRQIVLSADCSPAEIPSLEERLVSRFNSGLVALVDKPCLETRMAIVRTKARMRCLEVPEDVTRLLAARIESNVRELEGALCKLALLSQTRGGVIDRELALESLSGSSPSSFAVAIPDILSLVATRHNLRLVDLQGKRRTRSIAFPRQICMYLAREMTTASLEEIGGFFGGRDHTTVIHACRLIQKKRAASPELDSELERLSRELRNGT